MFKELILPDLTGFALVDIESMVFSGRVLVVKGFGGWRAIGVGFGLCF